MNYNMYKKLSFIKNVGRSISGSRWYFIMFGINIIFTLFIYSRYVYITNPKIVSVQKLENNTTEEKHYNNVEKRSVVDKNEAWILGIEYFDKDSNTIKETVLYDISIINKYKKTNVLPSIKNRNVDSMFYASMWIAFGVIVFGVVLKLLLDEDAYEIFTAVIGICFFMYIVICIYTLVEL